MRVVCSLLLAAAEFSPATAEVVLKRVEWQLRQAPPGKAYHATERWGQAPALPIRSRPRVLVSLVNRGPKPADGIVLRYAVSARLVQLGAGRAGIWTVPFWTEERRIPRVKANSVRNIPLDTPALGVFLKRALHSGHWPDALKVEVMVEPRAGEDLSERILDRTLQIAAP